MEFQNAELAGGRSMIDAWWPSVEQLMLAATDSKTRVLGILSPDQGAGVSVLCRMVATCFARAGIKALLIDLSSYGDPSETARQAWEPGLIPADAIQAEPGGFDMLVAPGLIDARPVFNNVEALRAMFADQLAGYKAIIVDLPPVLGQRADLVNPIAVARACDAVIMVCLAGATSQRRIKTALTALGTAGVEISGTIINDLHNPPMMSG